MDGFTFELVESVVCFSQTLNCSFCICSRRHNKVGSVSERQKTWAILTFQHFTVTFKQSKETKLLFREFKMNGHDLFASINPSCSSCCNTLVLMKCRLNGKLCCNSCSVTRTKHSMYTINTSDPALACVCVCV